MCFFFRRFNSLWNFLSISPQLVHKMRGEAFKFNDIDYEINILRDSREPGRKVHRRPNNQKWQRRERKIPEACN